MIFIFVLFPVHIPLHLPSQNQNKPYQYWENSAGWGLGKG